MAIYAHPVAFTSKLDESLANMKLSARGAIRKANNTIQTVVMVKIQTVVMAKIPNRIKKPQLMKTEPLFSLKSKTVQLLLSGQK